MFQFCFMMLTMIEDRLRTEHPLFTEPSEG